MESQPKTTKPDDRHPHIGKTQIHVVPATEPAERALVSAIRVAVFVEEQQIPLEVEFDLDDFCALHVLAYCDGRAVGTGRAVLFSDYAQIGRFAVLPGYRRHGVGGALVRYLTEYCSAHGVRRIVLHAQLHALRFYQQFGFTVTSSVFSEAGIQHCRMERAG